MLAGLVAAAALVLGAARLAREPLAPVAVVRALTTRVIERALARPAAPPARLLGSFQLTYYWLATEGRAAADDDDAVVLYSKSCHPIAEVSPRFAAALQMEGSGVLRDGRVVGIARTGCECGAPCYRLAQRSHTFGTGAAQRPLAPFRSVAVDSDLVALGSKLYLPELDGLVMPGPAPWGAFVHDGCVVADDRGGGVRGRQLDLFTAERALYKALSKQLGRRRVTVLDGSERCASMSLARPVAARRAGL